MAFDQPTRNRLARFVGDSRALLTEEFTRQLQNDYGLDPTSGEVTDLSRLAHLDDARRETARLLRETLAHYLAGQPKPTTKVRREALERIVREQAFTLLNRLCALRMMEARGLLLESVGRGYQSKGFQLYSRLAGPALGETGEAYGSYLLSLFDEFAVDLAVLFDRFSPQGRLFPRPTTLLQLLDQINHPEIDSLWAEDETIGWIYQYFNSVEERRQMRAESQAPRNSRELAVRNQFFTPRYVVEFLTDNTLGRLWYEMSQGRTGLTERCRYLVRRRHAIFLSRGEAAPQPYDPQRDGWGDPDLPGAMWTRPNPELADLPDMLTYGLTAGGYDYAPRHLGRDCGELANDRLARYRETGQWAGSFEELRCCLFFEQRRWRHFGDDPDEAAAQAIRDLHAAVCRRWEQEVEVIPYRPAKDPRDLKMLDPACGSMHFGLYAFDLFEQIYAEAWAMEAEAGPRALTRPPGLKPLTESYPDEAAFRRDIPA